MGTKRVYPGMLDSNYEFFNTEDGLKVMSNGKIIDFNAIPMPLYQLLKEEKEKHSEAHAILMEWYPDSEINRLKTFAKCRFGGLDYTPDITPETTQLGEYWDCPLRGACKGEGIVCLPLRFNDQILHNLEIKMIKLLTTSSTNEVISNDLNLSLGLFHKTKQKLYKKLQVQTKQEITIIAQELNLI